ncbi:MAG: hypothetical protein B7C55_04045 [Actinomycetales bacterium mxb001]|nr:MAG: hypothetical protein B7C55_04045 [Actinomycetales bacterium mxb001]
MLHQAPQGETRHRVAWLAALLVAVAAFGFLASAHPARAGAPIGTEPMADAPGATARLGIVVKSLSNVNLEDGTFHANFYLGVMCSTPCQADGWDLVNANSYTSEVSLDDSTNKWWRVSATFVFQPDLRLFPFDTQNLPIIVQHDLLTVDQLTFVPEMSRSEVNPDVGVPGWIVEQFTFTTTEHRSVALNETYSRAEFDIPIGRSMIASITKYYIPLLIFILLGAATLFLGRNDIQLRTAGTALVGLTIFYLFTSGGVGSVGYLTVWDMSVMVGYLALGLVMTSGIVGAYLYHEHKFDGPEGEALNKRIRFGFLWGIIAVVIVSGIAITLIAILT